VTNDTTPTFSGTATADSVTILVDGLASGTVPVVAGSWTYTVSTALADGEHEITARGTNAAGTGPASTILTVLIDTLAPSVPTHSIRLDESQLGTSTVPVRLDWASTDATSGIASYELRRALGATGAFALQTLPDQSVSPVTNVVQQLTAGNLYRFRVRAVDIAGNLGNQTPIFFKTVIAADETAAQIAYAPAWSTGTVAGAYGGSVRFSAAAGRNATYTFGGSDVGWVSTRGPARGRAEVRLDGVLVATVDLYTAAHQPRQLVYQATGLASGTHTLQVRVLGTRNAASTANRVDVDAFVRLN